MKLEAFRQRDRDEAGQLLNERPLRMSLGLREGVTTRAVWIGGLKRSGMFLARVGSVFQAKKGQKGPCEVRGNQ